MGYHKFKQGLAVWSLSKQRSDDSCISCEEKILKGENSYKNSHRHRLCTLCYNQWAESPENIRLGDIERNKNSFTKQNNC